MPRERVKRSMLDPHNHRGAWQRLDDGTRHSPPHESWETQSQLSSRPTFWFARSFPRGSLGKSVTGPFAPVLAPQQSSPLVGFDATILDLSGQSHASEAAKVFWLEFLAVKFVLWKADHRPRPLVVRLQYVYITLSYE